MCPISPNRAGAHNPEPANRPVMAFSRNRFLFRHILEHSRQNRSKNSRWKRRYTSKSPSLARVRPIKRTRSYITHRNGPILGAKTGLPGLPGLQCSLYSKEFLQKGEMTYSYQPFKFIISQIIFSKPLPIHTLKLKYSSNWGYCSSRA